jgi:glycogen(starch) synthase
MRTLLISNLYPPNALGGYERLCFSVGKELLSKGHQIGVLTSSYGSEEAEYAGQKIWRSLKMLATEGNIYQPFQATAAERRQMNEDNIAQLHRVVAEFQPDVIFVWNLFFFDASLVSALEEQYASKVVYFLTDNWLISLFNGEFLGRYFPQAVFGDRADDEIASVQGDIAIAGRAIFGSDYMQRLYAQAGLRFAHSEVIHNGVDLPDLSKASLPQRLSLLRHGQLRLLFAGRVVDLKGVETAIRALPEIIGQLPHLRVGLDIVGDCQDHAYLARIEGLIDELELGGHIHFREPVSPDALNELFQEYDIYLFPSLYEPFALTLIFALFAGIPTVASAAGGNVEIVFDGESGALFTKGDAHDLAQRVLQLVNDPVYRVGISRRGRVVSSQFTFATMIEKIDRSLRGLT